MFRLVAVSCDCYITTGSGIMYHYKAAQLLLYAQLFHTLDYFVYIGVLKHLSGVGSTDIDQGAAAAQTAVALLITECFLVQCDPEMASV